MARGLLRQGLWVFPVDRESKQPLTRNSFKDATTSATRIEAWWARNPEANPAIDCGRSGLVVVDSDTRVGFEKLCADHGHEVPGTFTVETSRGFHYWFRQPDGAPIGNPGVFKGKYDVDVRGDGGYVVAPGAVHATGTIYTVVNQVAPAALPDWLLGLVPRKGERKAGTAAPRAKQGHDETDDDATVTLAGATAALDAAIDEVRQAAEGQRNDTLHAKAYRLGRMVSSGLLDRGEVESGLLAAAAEAGLDAEEVSKTIASGLNAGERRPRRVAKERGRDKDPGDSAAVAVITYARKQYQFHSTPEGDVFGVSSAGIRRPILISENGGGALKSRITADMFRRDGRVPSARAIEDALRVLHSDALTTPGSQTLDLRVAERPGMVIVDLGEQGTARCVVVTAEGWALQDSPPTGVLFRTTQATKPLPVPSREGTLDHLRDILGWKAGDSRWALVRGWLVAACMPTTPRPMLAFTGQPGSAKTTRARLVLSVLDPRNELGSSFGKNEGDEHVMAAGRYLVGWDNITRASDEVSDRLCRMVTGEETIKRKLYTDAEQSIITFRRTGAITAVNLPNLRADALERLISIKCDRIDGWARRSESQIREAFEAHHPAILGGLMDALVQMLGNLEASRTRQADRVRMADFQDVLHALDPQVATVYAESVRNAMVEAAESDPFVSAVVEWLGRHDLPLARQASVAWEQASQFRHRAAPDDPAPWWPRSPRAFSDALARNAEPLNALGVQVASRRTKAGRQLTFFSPGQPGRQEPFEGVQR